MPSKIVPRHAGILELQKEPKYLAARAAAAASIAERARAIAPEETGRYRDGITSDAESAGSTFFTAHLIEWGTANTPAFAVMRKAVTSAGFRLDLEPK